METRILNLDHSVHALCAQYPELSEVLAQIGFTEIKNPGMLMSAGRFMTIPKGAALKKLDLSQIIATLAKYGFAVQE